MTPDHSRLCVELQRLEWARRISQEIIEEIVTCAETAHVQPGEVLFPVSTEITRVYFVISGRLEGIVFDRFDKAVHKETFARGSVVGLFSVMLPEASHLEVSAREPTTVMQFTVEEFLRLTAKHRDFQLAMFSAAANVVKRLVMVDRALPKPTVVGIVHQTEATRSLTVELCQRLRQLGESVGVVGDDAHGSLGHGIHYQPLYENGQLIEEPAIKRTLKELSSLGRLFIDMRADHSQETISRLLGYSEVILWCVRPSDVTAAMQRLQDLQSVAPWLRDKLRLVWILNCDQPAAPFVPELHQLVARDFKVHRGQSSPQQGMLLQKGTERIIHYLRGVQIGLALGGGAARGMAHLGVLKCLEQHGIYIDRLAGTSAGAMTGTVYAAGMGPEYTTQCFKTDLMPGWLFRQLPAGGYWYLLYKYRFNQFDSMLRKYLKQFRMEQLAIPVTTIAVDLVDGVLLARQTGDATCNILESINLPPLAAPILTNEQAVVDGGLLNNVPANVLVSQGCNFVIASTVTAKLEQDFMSLRSKKPLGARRFFSTMQVIMRQQMIQHYSMNASGVQPADFVIAPDVTSFDLSEFTRADEMSLIGEATTEQSIQQLKSMLAKLDPQLFG